MKLPILALLATLAGPAATAGDYATFRFELDLQDMGGTAGEAKAERRPVIAGDLVIFGTSAGFVYALDRRTGAKRWHFRATHYVRGGPAIAEDSVIFADNNGWLYRVGLADGRLRWKVRGVVAPTDPYSSADEIDSLITVAGELAYYRASDGFLHAARVSDGREAWKVQASGNGGPLVADGKVILGGYGVHAYDALTGALAWTYPGEGPYPADFRTGLTLADGRIYVGTFRRDFYAINASNGTRAWIFSDRKEDTWFSWYHPPALTDRAVVALQGMNEVMAFDRTNGALLWRSSVHGHYTGAPVYTGKLVIVGGRSAADQATLTAFDAATGRIAWEREYRGFDGFYATDSVYADGLLYFGDWNGSFFAVDTRDGSYSEEE